jgi:hypothetical protein
MMLYFAMFTAGYIVGTIICLWVLYDSTKERK